MATPFEAELEALVSRHARELTEEVTDLILGRLGIERGAARALTGLGRPRAAGSRGQAAPAAPAKKREKPAAGAPARRAGRGRPTSEQRAASLDEVARVVAGSSGMSVSEIERASGLARGEVASALRALKEQGRVFMGGTKRFARYAASQAAADRASADARGG